MTSAARIRLWFRIVVLGSIATIVATTPLLSADTPIGYRPVAYAIQGAKIVVGPDNTLENGTIVVRDGRIETVGPSDKVSVPLDAETIDGKGLVVYPGLIDLFTTIGQSPNTVRSRTGAGRSVDYKQTALARTPEDNRNGLTPEFEVASTFHLSEAQAAERRKLGFTDLLAAPAGAIATGQSALVSTSGGPRREVIVRSPIALHINLRAPFEPVPAPTDDDDHAAPSARVRTAGRYPSVLMGVVAHLRQAMLDAERQQTLKANPAVGSPRFAYDPALDALQAARTKSLPVWWEANTRDEIHRALDLAEEFGTTAVIVGGREAGKVVDRLKALDVPVVLRLDFPDEPKVPSEAEYRKRDLADRTEPYQVLVDRATRWKEQMGTAQTLAKAGVRFALASDGLAKPELFPGQIRKLIAGGLSREAALAGLTQGAARIAGLEPLLGTLEPGKLGHLVVLSAPFGDDEARVRYVLVDGEKFEVDKNGVAKKTESSASRPEAKGELAKAKTEEAKPKEAAKPEAAPKAATPPSPRTIEDQPSQTPFLDVATEFDHNRKPRLETKGNVLIKDATILTITPAGTIAKGSILVQNGKIAAVGPDLIAPEGLTVIDATGLVAMPGIIDSHSHIAIQGGGNEWSLSVVPEVRIKDVITGDDPAIYRALAGGTTTARILHGSADTIGGQDAVIKLKYRQSGRDLILKDAPQGIKFALGENVTRNPGRFPNTRMGVEATIDRAFQEARAYQEQVKAFEAAKAAGKVVPPPRRDLRLEALAGVLDGSIKIHSHCYRSDEILMLMRVAARHGVRVQSLQHVLEGYKIAPEIVAHGASASTFSDWWAYKVEAFDAIPYNAALMTEAGVSVSIKSDSEELIRHLNLEAAKMVKYGGLTEAQALAMITINPARELGLQDRLGTIEVGKDADISLFNAHPLDAFARCELALIEGEVWFQRSEKSGKFALRPGDHRAMPTSGNGARARVLDIPHNPKEVYALVGASIHPISGPDIANGTLVISEGKIAAVGDAGTMVPSSAQTIDLQGFDIWPGLVDAGTRLGLYEVNSLAETQDDADSAQFEPELRTSSALHPDSEIIPVSRANGILTAYVQPSGGLISGQGCVIGLNGWVPREMVIADPVALHVSIPRYIPPEVEGPGTRREGPDPIKKRTEQLESIVEEFHRALAYDKVVSDTKEKPVDAPGPDPRLAALVPYAKGRKPVIFHAEHRTEILEALKIAGTLKLKAIISGGADAWKVADALKAAKVPVLVGGTLRVPGEPSDPYDAPYANPARLHEAGVSFAIRSNPTGAQQATAARNLPYEAAIAVAFGLPEAEALKSVTLAPAQILGVSEQVGSLEAGKRANLVITAGHLLQPTTEVKALFLDGKPIDPKSRHTRLYEKYRRRLAEVRAGTAILGIDSPKVPAAPAPSAATPPATNVPSGQE
ncbi:Imidazolonepropionase [Singulisphaera sp. GP187]|uniref:amidohydrolase family protein n=1 Tax=Singulisphaera sp. GP187 TaxID=1882752 RepID=UPI00092B1D21|nr:amidohydrolase family protein [Singulisphaera sp. GP187]SIN89942.1 Imidazolonepropionase [Singulisphaera sp. GP187]